MQPWGSIAAIAIAAVGLSGCATVVPGQWTGTRTFVGVVRVDMPVTQGDVQAVRVRTLGAGAGRTGVFMGWEDGNWIVADPAKCQLLVVIRSSVEVDNAARVLHELRGQNACLVDETRE